jgi:hypothetical protein
MEGRETLRRCRLRSQTSGSANPASSCFTDHQSDHFVRVSDPVKARQMGWVPDLRDVIAKGGVKEKPDVDYLNDQQVLCK